MESPQTSKKKVNEGDFSLTKLNSTPKNQKGSTISDDFCLYHLHRESSPNFRAGQDVLEVGWGDSPEPLHVEKKYDLNNTPVTCKKKLEPKESPKSSIPFKRRNVRSSVSFPSKSIIDIAKYVAEVQELSKNIMKEFNGEKELINDKIDSAELIENNKLSPSLKSSRDFAVDRDGIKIIHNNRLSPSLESSRDSLLESKSSSSTENKDPSFDNVLQMFINEEDDWLSQALSSQELVKTPLKGSFVKSKSENELTLPQPVGLEKKNLTQNCRNLNNNFRRTASFDLTKSPNNPSKNINETKKSLSGNVTSNQYSVQEIERKRLEAKYRRERREIERKKLEALKKLEMKKLRAIKI